MDVRFQEPFNNHAYQAAKKKDAKAKVTKVQNRQLMESAREGSFTVFSVKHTINSAPKANDGADLEQPVSETNQQCTSRDSAWIAQGVAAQLYGVIDHTTERARGATPGFLQWLGEAPKGDFSTTQAGCQAEADDATAAAILSPIANFAPDTCTNITGHDGNAVVDSVATSLNGQLGEVMEPVPVWPLEVNSVPSAINSEERVDSQSRLPVASPTQHVADTISDMNNASTLNQEQLDVNRVPEQAYGGREGHTTTALDLESTSRHPSQRYHDANEGDTDESALDYNIDKMVHSFVPEEEELEGCIEVASPGDFEDCESYVRAPTSGDAEAYSGEWEAHRIIGEEIIHGKVHYMIEWKPSLVSEDDAQNASQLVQEWHKRKAKIRAGAKKRLDRGKLRANKPKLRQ